MWWDGDNVMGKIEVLDTPSGRILKDLLKSGVKLGISSRGMGSVTESRGSLTVEDDFQLICFDMVSEPSTPGAYLSPEQKRQISSSIPVTMAESADKKSLSKKEKINSAMDDALKGLL